jgi:hypothetical protein
MNNRVTSSLSETGMMLCCYRGRKRRIKSIEESLLEGTRGWKLTIKLHNELGMIASQDYLYSKL